MGKRELIPSYTIPDRETVRSTPGLQHVDWPQAPQAHILLGIDFLPLFYGERSPFCTSNVLIEETKLGLKIAGLLGSSEMISERQNRWKNMMACDMVRASVGTCATGYSIPPSPIFENKTSPCFPTIRDLTSFTEKPSLSSSLDPKKYNFRRFIGG